MRLLSTAEKEEILHSPGGPGVVLVRVQQPRLRIRPLAAALYLLVLFAPYLGSYAYLSRRGMREAQQYGMKSFLYMPAQEATGYEEMRRHYRLAAFFAPVNELDQALFGADAPVRCIYFGLSR
jgi:hypothetical protein